MVFQGRLQLSWGLAGLWAVSLGWKAPEGKGRMEWREKWRCNEPPWRPQPTTGRSSKLGWSFRTTGPHWMLAAMKKGCVFGWSNFLEWNQFPKKADWWLTLCADNVPSSWGRNFSCPEGEVRIYMTICEPLTSVQGSICLAWTEAPANFCPLDLLPSCTGLPCSYLSNEGLISRFKRDSLLTESGQ